ncbi:hypothetical protein C8R34_10184 [Nitrosomonas sp. Nm84]|uniref:exopolysaccharide biosynthesis protein n=1 Tax=Nitrosomonas sp. Nm84 TaxID=200124 RepID=UPI000D75A2ED|nr:exopolysaccharide biosynthesis protein [Nitrosomonas sp. Nm84]PXW91175.1 hypothetical protein C8R34_10184 [Nitrosomonas sp. Nm84]
MTVKEKERPTSDFLAIVVVENKQEAMTVGEIKNALHERGFGILMAIAALPICLPVPVPPGYTTLFSIPLFIFSIQMVLGMRAPWLPAWIEKKCIQRVHLEKIVAKANPWLKKLENRMQPRMTYIGVHTWERIIGIFSFVFALSISLPLPLTNFPPGCGILIMSLGLLNRDGVTILIGMMIGTIGIGITMIVLVMLWMGMSMPSFY